MTALILSVGGALLYLTVGVANQAYWLSRPDAYKTRREWLDSRSLSHYHMWARIRIAMGWAWPLLPFTLIILTAMKRGGQYRTREQKEQEERERVAKLEKELGL